MQSPDRDFKRKNSQIPDSEIKNITPPLNADPEKLLADLSILQDLLSFDLFHETVVVHENGEKLRGTAEALEKMRARLSLLPVEKCTEMLALLGLQMLQDERALLTCDDELLGAVYNQNLHRTFVGLADFDPYLERVENLFIEKLQDYDAEPLSYILYNGLISQEVLNRENVSRALEDRINFVVQNRLPEIQYFAVVPGFKEKLEELRANPDSQLAFKKFVSDYLEAYAIQIAGEAEIDKIAGEEASFRYGRDTYAALISQSLEYLGIPGVLREPAFINSVGTVIKLELQSGSAVSLSCANQWICLLPRELNNLSLLTPEAQQELDALKPQAIKLIKKMLKSPELGPEDVTIITRTVSHFKCKKLCSGAAFRHLISDTALRLLDKGARIHCIRRLLRIMPRKDQHQLIEAGTLRFELEKSFGEGSEAMNRSISYIQEMDDTAKLNPRYAAQMFAMHGLLQKSAFYFNIPCEDLLPLPEAVRDTAESYHYLCDVATKDYSRRREVKLEYQSVNQFDWLAVAEKALDAFYGNDLIRSELYSSQAINLALCVPGIEEKAGVLADLLQLRALTETNLHERGKVFTNELFMRMRNMPKFHPSVSSTLKSYAELLKEKSKTQDSQGELKKQAAYLEQLAENISKVSRFKPGDAARRELVSQINLALGDSRLHKALNLSANGFKELLM